MRPMPQKTSANLIDELENAQHKSLIEVSYKQTENNSTQVTIYFAEDIKTEARLNFARYLNHKYLLFNSKFVENYSMYIFTFCPRIMTMHDYFDEKLLVQG